MNNISPPRKLRKWMLYRSEVPIEKSNKYRSFTWLWNLMAMVQDLNRKTFV